MGGPLTTQATLNAHESYPKISGAVTLSVGRGRGPGLSVPAAAPRSAGRAARDPPRHTVTPVAASSHPSQTVGPLGTRRHLSLKRDGGAWTAGRALLLLALLLLLLALALVRAIARGGGADRPP